jgi:hypothetical protein
MSGISKTMAATAQTQLDQNMSAWKALITVKSLRGAMDLRASLLPKLTLHQNVRNTTVD